MIASAPLRLAAAALAALLALPPAWAGDAPRIEIRRLPGGEAIASMDALVEMARGVDLVVIGEIHDNPLHQNNQATLARALAPGAIAFEMVPRSAENAVAEVMASGGDAASGATRARAEWDEYAPYHVVMEAAPEARIIGAGISRDDIKRAMKKGAGHVFEILTDRDPEAWDLVEPLSPELQAEMEEEQHVAHCEALPPEMLPGMVEGQRLRDAVFAEALLRARAAAPEGTQVMLVTGNGHARRDRGSPAYLQMAAPELRTLVIGQVELREGEGWRDALDRWQERVPVTVFDVLIAVPEAEREDPCEAFLKSRGG